MQKYLIKNIGIVNEGHIQTADVLIAGERIEKIDAVIGLKNGNYTEIIGEGKYLFPGCIDDQVHFREPGLTYPCKRNNWPAMYFWQFHISAPAVPV